MAVKRERTLSQLEYAGHDGPGEARRVDSRAMKDAFHRSRIGAFFLALCWSVLAQDLPVASQDPFAAAKAQASAGNLVDAIGLLRGVVRDLPRNHPASKDARILLCEFRAGESEAASAPTLDLLQDAPGGGIQLPERLLAPDPRIEQGGCFFTKGVVLVEVIVDQDGCVVATRLLTPSALPQVNEAALATLKNWVYLPVFSQGKAVASRFLETGRVSPGPMLSFSPQKRDD